MNLEGVLASHWTEVPALELFPGVHIRVLWGSDAGPKAYYLEFAAGSRFTTLDIHAVGPEEVFVVSGVYNDGANDYPAGSFIHNPTGSSHLPQSAVGCVVFIFMPEG